MQYVIHLRSKRRSKKGYCLLGAIPLFGYAIYYLVSLL